MLLSTLRLVLLATLTASTLLVAQDEGQPKPITAAQALKLGPEKLTDLTNPSEAGQDQAAILYATAKRLQTENALAKRDLQAVLTLEEWRTAIQPCRESVFSLAYIINGGGTMYSHGSARDTAEVEDFLAELASSLPLAEGEGDAKATQQIDNAMTFLKKLDVGDLGDADATKEAQKNLKEEIERIMPHWEGLKSMISAVPAAEAKKIATFTVSCLSWLKDE
jgi:predicted pyridoxine 5'-phosphate oxidase superfamily flavin-nucleotide-binding protein